MNITQYSPDFVPTAGYVVQGMPNAAYHAHDSISKSSLDSILRSPAHFKYRRFVEPTRAMEIGTAIHTALLEPDRFITEYVLLENVKDRRAAEYKQAVEKHGTEKVLTSPEVLTVAGMQQSVTSHPVASLWLQKKGYRELSIFAQDPVTGINVRIRPDALTTDGHILDLKKTQDARPSGFSRTVATYRYHVQAAFYSDVYQWATGQKAQSFRFIVVEESLPHACMVYRLDDFSLEEGRRVYRQALNLYAECLESDKWDAYPCSDDEIISLPDWQIRQIENELEVNLGE
jgi:exodeoxyribonuclease VIII